MHPNNLLMFLNFISSIINDTHDQIVKECGFLGWSLTDKHLHFIIIALIGIVIYLITNEIFKFLARYNVAILSFIYTFTVLVVIVFAIEIEQKITKRGSMEVDDIIAGLLGFLVFFTLYLASIGVARFIKIAYKNYSNSTKHKNDLDKKC